MALQRPAWTCCFCFVWALIVPGAILTHYGLIEAIPWLQDLPANIDKGLDEALKFSYLKRDCQMIVQFSKTAIERCDVNTTVCASQNYPSSYTPPNKEANNAQIRTEIKKILDDSLATVNKVAHDQYFGVTELQPTARDLEKIIEEFDKTQDVMPCQANTPVYCEIYVASDDILDGIDEVDKVLDSWTNGDVVQRFNDYSDHLVALHALPYIMVLGMLCYSCFWMKGGVCCCCKGGTAAGWLIIPFMIFWLLSFITYTLVCGVGLATKYFGENIPIDFLNGEPTLKEVLEHIQNTFPEFWNIVFKDMETGLAHLLNASFFFVAASLIILLYAGCECCCCPYRKKEDDA